MRPTFVSAALPWPADTDANDCPPGPTPDSQPALSPRYLPVQCSGPFRSDRMPLTRPVPLWRPVLLLCVAREEEKGYMGIRWKGNRRNEPKDKTSVLTFVAFLPRPPPQVIVSNNHWPHHDQGHSVARGPEEGENSVLE